MEYLSQLVVLQWIGTLFGVVQVLLARQNNIHNYLFGIIAILISIWVLYQSQLYADILLNMYYLVMSIYGWFYWKMGKQQQNCHIRPQDVANSGLRKMRNLTFKKRFCHTIPKSE